MKQAYKIKDFCKAYNISTAHLYRQWDQGVGPPRKKCVGIILISVKDAEEWFNALPDHGKGKQAVA